MDATTRLSIGSRHGLGKVKHIDIILTQSFCGRKTKSCLARSSFSRSTQRTCLQIFSLNFWMLNVCANCLSPSQITPSGGVQRCVVPLIPCIYRSPFGFSEDHQKRKSKVLLMEESGHQRQWVGLSTFALHIHNMYVYIYIYIFPRAAICIHIF